MQSKRHYFISDDLDDLEHIEQELVNAGITTPHIHVLSRSNADVQQHPDLNPVRSMMKRDIIHSAVLGALIGWALALMAILIPLFAGWTNTSAGFMPFIFLAIALFGFSTWLGGLHGLSIPNHHFKRFQNMLDNNKHVFFVDLEHSQEELLEQVCATHPKLVFAGTGKPMPQWALWLEDKTKNWWYWRMWRNA